jgi:hypothetical protein
MDEKRLGEDLMIGDNDLQEISSDEEKLLD